MNVQEGEVWGLLTTLHLVATMNYNNVIFELDFKMMTGKVNNACGNLTELRNIIVEYKKMFVTHSLWNTICY